MAVAPSVRPAPVCVGFFRFRAGRDEVPHACITIGVNRIEYAGGAHENVPRSGKGFSIDGPQGVPGV